ncbi:hypothetical protein QTI90_23940 [Pectobacterium brasiliense]|nr:hypothetical protein [Pectobacterium brasiliense]WJM81183.1 hypothetical protein QTI90_23940 [Pectobacterium brasiliense]
MVTFLVLHRQVIVGFNAGDSLIINLRVGIMFDVPDHVILNKRLEIFLPVNINLLLTGLILEAQFIKPFSL